jgi:hypothetical protein
VKNNGNEYFHLYPIIIQQKIVKNEEDFNCRWRAKYCNGSGIYQKKNNFEVL